MEKISSVLLGSLSEEEKIELAKQKGMHVGNRLMKRKRKYGK